MNYIFDGGYYGYLTAIFEAFERKEFDVTPTTELLMEHDIFQQRRAIVTDIEKAQRVNNALEKIIGSRSLLLFYHNFLADSKEAWFNGFNLIIGIFQNRKFESNNYGDLKVSRLHQTVKMVNRERHRMKAFVRFVKSADGLYIALVEPDFNVLPLITDFFKNRFSDQNWLIFDVKRNYGILFDQHDLNQVYLQNEVNLQYPYSKIDIDPREMEFQHLWKTYFKSTNIESRKNLKLHLRHVPKRYWKFLIEKN